MANLADMINTRQLDFEFFLKMHPFSASNKNVYDDALESIDFFEELHIKTVEMYARLSEISNVLSTGLKNLVIITGYRGCGKTNFLRYIEYLANGGEINQTLQETYKHQLRCADDAISFKKQYRETKNAIYITLQGAVDEEHIEGKVLNRHIEKSIRSEPTYLNFDIGGFHKEKPLSTKIYYLLEGAITDCISDGTIRGIVRIIDGFVKRNRSAIQMNFEQIDNMELSSFWDQVKLIFDASEQNEANISKLLCVLKTITLEHLLFAFFLWEFALHIVKKPNNDAKLLYLLDNIDMISNKDGVVFRNTIQGIFSYICNSRHLFSEIARNTSNTDDKQICAFYTRTNLIIAMRETSAMKITDHDRKAIRQDMNNFDISEDVDKVLVLKKKLDLAEKLISAGKITNHYFIRKIENLKWLLRDELMIHRIILLNNNDVRTTIQLISKLCDYPLSTVARRNTTISNKDDYVFGIRGIVFKQIFKLYYENNYFRDLRINDSRNKAHTFPYSAARIILTILYKQRERQTDRVLFNPAEYIELRDLFNEVCDFMSPAEFEIILDRMYAHRDAIFWNHLVTFDNVSKYSKKDISNYLSVEPCNEESSIYLSITPAGQAFLAFVCVHFEYFSVRFCVDTDKALFEYDSLRKRDEQIIVKNTIKTVFEAVQNCCAELQQYNLTVLRREGENHYEKIRAKHYNYSGIFHEERLIHNHISYLNAYRNYVISKAKDLSSPELHEMSDFIISYIKQYLNLLHTDDLKAKVYREVFISDRSRSLFNSLMVCIEKFEYLQKQGRSDWRIDFTREYYRDHYEKDGVRCKLFRERAFE